jgi:ribosomal protein L40E
MVYCTECGTKNDDTAEVCVKCGTKLHTPREKSLEKRIDDWGEGVGKSVGEWGERFGKRAEEWGKVSESVQRRNVLGFRMEAHFSESLSES